MNDYRIQQANDSFPPSHLHQAHVRKNASAGDTGLAALIQHPGYAAHDTQRRKQECPGQGDLSVKGGGNMVNCFSKHGGNSFT